MKAYHYLNYIDGKWLGVQQPKNEIFNPATGDLVGTVVQANTQQIKQTVAAASVALLTWSQKTASERAQLLMAFHHLILAEKPQLAALMTQELGRPIKESLGEVDYAASFIEWFAEEGKRIYGRTIPGKTENQRIKVIKQPIGVVAAITPWNFPASMITRKLGPALASGCTFIVKPAEQTPLTALRLAELSQQAGIPKGVFNVVCSDPEQFTEVVMHDMRVRKITFTGSTEVGKLLMKQSAEQVKRVSLELGGHAPFIVCDDADLDQAIQGLMSSKFRNSGQTCVCANRIYVQEKIYEAFIEKLAEKIRKLRVGNGIDENVDIGPLIDKNSYHKVEKQVNQALENGAKCVVGGNGIADEQKQTYFFEPTLLIDMKDEMKPMQEETFGPVAPIQKFADDDEVIRWANGLDYGLAAYVFTQNVSRGTKMTENLEFGIVGWNDGVPSAAQAPFGGVKQSGLGREGAMEGIEEYLTTKYISLNI